MTKNLEIEMSLKAKAKLNLNIRTNLFFYFFFLFAILGALFTFLLGREESFLLINKTYNADLGQFFRYYTHVGDGLFFVIFIIALLFVRYYYALIALFCFGIPSIISHVLKRLVFSDQLRPAKYFESKAYINLTEGVEVHASNSFPSGHTITAFAMFMFLSLITKNKILQIFYFVLALLVGVSRIYIAQHFVVDVYFGALIGVWTAYLCCFIIQNYSKLWQYDFWNSSFLRKFN